MGQVKTFELLHGIVLIKILRTNKETLKLVETDTRKAWSAYTINDEVIVYIKYSRRSRKTQKEGKLVWAFLFQSSELKKIMELRIEKPVYVALVCGDSSLSEIEKMQVCLLEPKELDICISLTEAKKQTISVEYKPGESLRAFGPRNSEEKQKLIVSRSKIDDWEIPGS